MESTDELTRVFSYGILKRNVKGSVCLQEQKWGILVSNQTGLRKTNHGCSLGGVRCDRMRRCGCASGSCAGIRD